MRRPRRGGVAALAVIPLSLMALFAYFIATYEGPLLPGDIGPSDVGLNDVGDDDGGDNTGAPGRPGAPPMSLRASCPTASVSSPK